jgi:hypothetical protein
MWEILVATNELLSLPGTTVFIIACAVDYREPKLTSVTKSSP